MIPVQDCSHETLQFGSGDFYLFCHECGSSWGRIGKIINDHGFSEEKLDSLSANIGAGSQLSGQARKV